MSAGVRSAAAAAIVLAALLSLMAGSSLLIPLVLAAAAVALALVPLARWRPERTGLLLALLVIAGGTLATCIRVADGVADARVQYRGTLDVEEILRSFHPGGRAGPALGYGYISSGQAVTTKPDAGSGALVLWSIAELAPWLLAAIVLALLVPILRAAERNNPFWAGATRRLEAIGVLVLVGIPAIALLEYVAAEAASAGTFSAPVATPALTLSPLHVLPGVLVLVLAGVFRRGAELRDFERHAV